MLYAAGIATLVAAMGQQRESMPTVVVAVPDVQTYLRLPSIDAIEKVEAELHEYEGMLGTCSAIPRFVVPREDHREILKYFLHPRVDTLPRLSYEEIGTITVTTKAGTVTRIHFFWGRGHQPLSFCIRGIRLENSKRDVILDEGLAIDGCIRLIHERVSSRRND